MEGAVPNDENAPAMIITVPFVGGEEDPERKELQRALETLQRKYNDLQTNQRKLVAQNAAVLAGLECPVCFGYLVNNRAIMCENGHNVCENCNNGVLQCPVCRCSRGEAKNLFVDLVGNATLRPCKYSEIGCFALYTLLESAERELHEDSCPHRFQCRMFLEDNEDDELAYCQWRGNREDFAAHCIDQHPMMNGSEAMFHVPIPMASARTYLEMTFPIRCHNELFLLTFHYRRDGGGSVLASVPMFMGKQEDLEKFKVSVYFISRDKKRKLGVAGFPCEPIREDFPTILSKHPHLDRGMLRMFAKTNTIDCAVRISLAE